MNGRCEESHCDALNYRSKSGRILVTTPQMPCLEKALDRQNTDCLGVLHVPGR